jgi:hypothetical protein
VDVSLLLNGTLFIFLFLVLTVLAAKGDESAAQLSMEGWVYR